MKKSWNLKEWRRRKRRHCPTGKGTNDINGQSPKEIKWLIYFFKKLPLVTKDMQIQVRFFFQLTGINTKKKLQKLITPSIRKHAKKWNIKVLLFQAWNGMIHLESKTLNCTQPSTQAITFLRTHSKKIIGWSTKMYVH